MKNESILVELSEHYEISKLDINRIYRYIEKYTNTEVGDEVENTVEHNSSDEEN
jgi:hypothetical protein